VSIKPGREKRFLKIFFAQKITGFGSDSI